ncbi:hypothetical protein IAR50_006074 [Cryptococcus sp. DSM 104548]
MRITAAIGAKTDISCAYLESLVNLMLGSQGFVFADSGSVSRATSAGSDVLQMLQRDVETAFAEKTAANRRDEALTHQPESPVATGGRGGKQGASSRKGKGPAGDALLDDSQGSTHAHKPAAASHGVARAYDPKRRDEIEDAEEEEEEERLGSSSDAVAGSVLDERTHKKTRPGQQRS